MLQYDRQNNRVGIGAAPCQKIGNGQLVLDPCDPSLIEEARYVLASWPEPSSCYKPSLRHQVAAFMNVAPCQICHLKLMGNVPINCLQDADRCVIVSEHAAGL